MSSLQNYLAPLTSNEIETVKTAVEKGICE